MIRIARNTWGIGGFFDKGGDRALPVGRHYAEPAGLRARDHQATDRHIRARIDVLLQHQLIVHLVDVIARKDHHVLGHVGLDDVDVLEHRIGGALVP